MGLSISVSLVSISDTLGMNVILDSHGMVSGLILVLLSMGFLLHVVLNGVDHKLVDGFAYSFSLVFILDAIDMDLILVFDNYES